MAFPSFVCVCADESCPSRVTGMLRDEVWSEDGSELLQPECVVNGSGEEVLGVEVRRIAGTSWFNTCQYWSAVVFEAAFCRGLRRFVERGLVQIEHLDDALRLVEYRRAYPAVESPDVARAAGFIRGLIAQIERDIGPYVIAHFQHHVFEAAGRLIRKNRAILDPAREPSHWPRGDELAAIERAFVAAKVVARVAQWRQERAARVQRQAARIRRAA